MSRCVTIAQGGDKHPKLTSSTVEVFVSVFLCARIRGLVIPQCVRNRIQGPRVDCTAVDYGVYYMLRYLTLLSYTEREGVSSIYALMRPLIISTHGDD